MRISTHDKHFQLILKKQRAFRKEKFSEEFNKEQLRIFLEVQRNQEITPQDEELWSKFRKIVLEDKRKNKPGENFFRGEHVFKLGVEADIYFIYGGKNIGKTYSTGCLISEILKDPKRHIMYLRTTKSEIDTALERNFVDENWPFTFKKSGSELIRKPGYLLERGETPKKKKGKKVDNVEKLKRKIENPNLCGGATHITGLGLRAFQGGSYPTLKDLFWDECNDVQEIDHNVLFSFLIFVLSLERRKKDFKIYLIGNLIKPETGTTSNIFLEALGVPYECNLKYKTTSKGTRILYINPGAAGDLYDGLEESIHTDMFGSSLAQDLTSNLPAPESVKVLNKSIFLNDSIPRGSYVLKHEQSYYIVYLAEYSREVKESTSPDESQLRLFILCIEPMKTAYNHTGYFPITDIAPIANNYGNITYKKPRHISKIVKKIHKFMKRQILGYADDQTRQLFCNILYEKQMSRYKELMGDNI